MNRQRCVECGRLFLKPFRKAVDISEDREGQVLGCPECEKPLVNPRVHKLVEKGYLDDVSR